jgi:Response regulators consisting of a CheY-like receiver domain and a winged-helix DNA-binding domain
LATVLLVEDEVKLRDLVRTYLERDGLTVLSTGSGAQALELARTVGPDLVVLDLGLPDVPGEEVAAELRRFGPVPILMLTARSAVEDRIAGLELGADDYVTKPFSPRELVLRVRAILRRGGLGPGQDSEVASYGGAQLVVDSARHRVVLDGDEVSLTPTEWGILTVLATAPGRVFGRSELINLTARGGVEVFERTVDSHVRNLRRKVERDSARPEIVQTVHGVGYRFGLSRDG